MFGIYIHIPFCASRCIYCDFYSTTHQDKASSYVEALIREMEDRKAELSTPDTLRTIYIGGGTPSQLPVEALRRLVEGLRRHFDLSQVEEFTIEVNPEDVTPEYAYALAQLPINRVSMGVQTFVEEELRILCRRHDAQRPLQAVEWLRKVGIENISIDLMYGLPSQTLASWQKSISQALSLHVPHLSAYCLSVEEDTRLHRLLSAGKINVVDEENTLVMAEMLREQLRHAGYEQYEISNYALPGYHSRHNSSYWQGIAYLGLGAGAHSYDGKVLRSFNAPDLSSYIAGQRECEHETLSATDLYNEMIMLSLRTMWGVDTQALHKRFVDHPYLIRYFEERLPDLLQRGNVLLDPATSRLRLTEAGLAMADEVMRDLFYL